MFNVSDNPQVVYSLNALSNSLFDIMQEKNFSDITVSEICEKAQITRRTFYRNCDNKKDLIDYAVIKSVREQLKKVDFSCEDTEVLFRSFFSYWQKRKTLLSVLYKQDLFERFQHCFVYVCVNEINYPFLDKLLSGKEKVAQEKMRLYHNAFTVGGLCGILELWAREDFTTPVSDLVNVTAALAPVS